MKGIQIALQAPLSGSPLGRCNCSKLPVSSATRGFLVYQLLRKYGAFTFFGVIGLLLLVLACSAPIPTSTPVPTLTPTAVPTPTPEPLTGNWIRNEATSPMDDSRMISIELLASESTGRPPLLSVLCLVPPRGNAETMVVIKWGAYLGFEDWTAAGWRVDSKNAQVGTWDLQDGDTIKAPNPAPFVRDLHSAEKIAAQVVQPSPPHESVTAVWHTEGFTEAYKPVEEECKQ